MLLHDPTAGPLRDVRMSSTLPASKDLVVKGVTMRDLSLVARPFGAGERPGWVPKAGTGSSACIIYYSDFTGKPRFSSIPERRLSGSAMDGASRLFCNPSGRIKRGRQHLLHSGIDGGWITCLEEISRR